MIPDPIDFSRDLTSGQIPIAPRSQVSRKFTRCPEVSFWEAGIRICCVCRLVYEILHFANCSDLLREFSARACAI